MNVCSICAHKDRLSIDASLATLSASAVALTYGVGVQSLRRHRRSGHIAGAPSSAKGTSGTSPGGSSDPLSVMEEALDRLRSMDPGRISPAAQVARIDAMRRTSESIAKLRPAVLTEQPFSIPEDHPPGIRPFIEILFRNLEVVACEACGHHNGPALRATIANDIKEEGL